MAILRKRVLLVTGNPGVGKTTVLLRVVEALKVRGFSVGGMLSREVRSCGARIGFEILDLGSNSRGWLAHVNQKSGPQIGRYRVNIEDLDGIGVEAIARAAENCDVVTIDEIGPMELHSEKFKEAVKRVVESGKLVVGTVHSKARDTLIDAIKAREDAEIYRVTYDNRINLHETIIEKATEFLKQL